MLRCRTGTWVPSQVVGYDVSLPAEVQLDKLTDAQLREIARRLDPLAREPAPAAKLD